jgi:hypothetical protein
MYYLRKAPEISFIEIRPVLECMMAANKKLTVAQVWINTIKI